MDDDWVSASEISEWVYCRRALRIERRQRPAGRLLVAGLALALLLGTLVAIGGWR
jgi:hypothetical protein